MAHGSRLMARGSCIKARGSMRRRARRTGFIFGSSREHILFVFPKRGGTCRGALDEAELRNQMAKYIVCDIVAKLVFCIFAK